MYKTKTFILSIFFFSHLIPLTGQNAAIDTAKYFPSILGKSIGVVTNANSMVNDSTNLIDFLLARNIKISVIFTPEHGFGVDADAGKKINDSTYRGIPVISLYGKNKKPKPEHFDFVRHLLFDLQDVGVRFYTYLSTLHYVMEAAAESHIPMTVLDRPNPNIHYIDGPVLKPKYSSFVGMHPVPIVYGMTIGEYALMINGEGWLKNKASVVMRVIQIPYYTRQIMTSLNKAPSPNLRTDKAINLYPSLCLFEGTNVSVGRGTPRPFEIYGSPDLPEFFPLQFIPIPTPGARHPKHERKTCNGFNLKDTYYLDQINLVWLSKAYRYTKNKKTFFNSFFNKLAGNSSLRKKIEKGMDPEEIRNSWKKELQQFKKVRAKYLLYP